MLVNVAKCFIQLYFLFSLISVSNIEAKLSVENVDEMIAEFVEKNPPINDKVLKNDISLDNLESWKLELIRPKRGANESNMAAPKKQTCTAKCKESSWSWIELFFGDLFGDDEEEDFYNCNVECKAAK